ncbi:hypothetical protein NKG94_28035 [Micromonospora sp. M12]
MSSTAPRATSGRRREPGGRRAPADAEQGRHDETGRQPDASPGPCRSRRQGGTDGQHDKQRRGGQGALVQLRLPVGR